MPGIIILIIVLGGVIGFFTVFLIRSILLPKRVATLANLIKQGRSGPAIRIAKHLISKDTRNQDAHYFLGLAYLNENKPELALMEMKTVNQIGRFDGYAKEVPFRKQSAELFARFNQVEESLKEYLLLIKLEPYEANHYFKAGELFEQRNSTEKALNYYRKAVEIAPGHAEAHYKLGYLLYRSKKPVEAKAEFETTLKYQSENYKAHFYLGRILKESHDYVAALVSFEKAQRDPEFKVKALVERGGCYMNMNNFDRAISELERALKLSENPNAPESLYGRYFLGVCYEKTRQIDKAIEQWEKIYAKKPAFRDVAEKLSHYQELQTDDRMKDYLTSSKNQFIEICKAVTEQMELSIRDTEEITNGCQFVAVEPDSGKWRNTKKMPRLIQFLRVPEIITDSTVRALHEEMRKQGIARGIIVTSSTFSKLAIDYAETRPINLYNKDQLKNFLKKIQLNGKT